MKFLTGVEVHRRSNGAVTYNRIRNALLSGDLPAQKLGQAYMVEESDADDWLKQCAERDAPSLSPLQARIAALEAENAELRARLGGEAA